MEMLVGFGLTAGATAFGFWRAHRTAREEGKEIRSQVEPIVQEVSGPPGKPGMREMLHGVMQDLKVIGEDAREAKESATNSARHSAAFHTDMQSMEGRLSDRIEESDAKQAKEIGMLTGRVDGLDNRVLALEGLGREVFDLRGRIETVGGMRKKDLELSDAATGAGETPPEGGPGSARATRPDSPPPTAQPKTLSKGRG